MKLSSAILALALACALPATAADSCANGVGTWNKMLWDGFSVQLQPGAGEQQGKCHVSVASSAAEPIFDHYAAEIAVHEYTGKDVNNDGKPDLIITARAESIPGLTYYVISLADPAGVARQITTMFPLSFEDRDGDGKLEIWTREYIFAGIDGLATDDSPFPPVAFRLLGNRLIYVSPSFASEYDRAIAEARQRITEDGLKELRNDPTTGEQVQKERGGSDKKKDDPKIQREIYETKAGVLDVVIAYLYAGKGAEAWKELNAGWGFRDRDRIRQIILRARPNGILKQLNAPQPATQKQASVPPASPPSSPQ